MKILKDLTILKKGRERPDSAQTMFYDVIQIGELQEICYPGQLKQEAIKWAKFYKNIPEYKRVIGWIMVFFDLSEEDIK